MHPSAAFARRLALREGAAGRSWLRSVAASIAELTHRWSCERDGALRYGGVAVIAPVRGPMGPAVIKLSFPHPDVGGEAAALRLLDGAGAVQLYAYAADRSALLLERADGHGPQATLDVDQSIEMMGGLSARLAVPAEASMRTLADTAAGWRRLIDAQASTAADAPVTPAALQRAREAIGLAGSDSTPTLLHGDLHEGNVLHAIREPWLVIDPKGWAGTAAWDAFTVAMSRHEDPIFQADPTRHVRRRIRRFATVAQVDPDAAIELSHARAMSSLLFETITGDRNYGVELLRRFVDEPI